MILLILLIFVLELWMGATQGDTPNAVERGTRELAATALLASVMVGYLCLVGREAFRSTPFRMKRSSTSALAILAVWSVVAVGAAIEGLLLQNDPNFILGDLFKFCLLPLLFVLVYYSIREPSQLDTVLQGYAVIFGVALLVEFFLMFSWIRQGGRFANTVSYHIATVEPILIYLILMRKGNRAFRFLLWLIAGEIAVAIILIQGLSDYAYAALAATVFLVYFRRRKLALLIVFAGMLAFVGIRDPFHIFGPQENYAGHKLNLALDFGGTSEVSFLEWASGSRLGEIEAVLRGSVESPRAFLFGYGMGSLIEALPVEVSDSAIMITSKGWKPEKHFIHSGLFEVFYRTGAIGLGVLLFFFAYVYRRGWKLAQGEHRNYGRFVMANTVFQFLNIVIQSPLTYVWLILAIALAGTYVLEQKLVPVTTRVRRPGRVPVRSAGRFPARSSG